VWDIAVTHTEPVKAVKLLLRGLCADCLEAGWWSPSSGRMATHGAGSARFQWVYPGPDWPTPWASATGAGHATVLSVRDRQVNAKSLHVHRPWYAHETVVELIHVPPAGDRTAHCDVPPIRLLDRVPEHRLDRDLADHLSFLESAHHLVPWEDRTDVPAWARDIALVVTLHGQHWTGHVFNTFSDIREILEFVSQHVDPRRVLAYLPGWEGRYYYDYPTYQPGEDLGGTVEFAKLAAHAHDLGVRLMPMFGANGANVARYAPWQESAILNDTGRYVELVNRPDWDGDRFGEGDQVFLNPGEPRFRAHLVDAICSLATRYGIDAAFLDTAGFWSNDPRYRLYDGYRALVEDVHARQPDLLLAAEGWWDAMLALFPLSQQWLGYDRDIRTPQLLTRYARTTGHLAEGTPGGGSTGVHEQGHRRRPADRPLAGHIPVLSFVDNTLAEHTAEVVAACRWAAEHMPRSTASTSDRPDRT
jgi:hypothetical protein